MEKKEIYDPQLIRNIYITLLTNSDITSTIPQLTQIIDEFRELFPNISNMNFSQKSDSNEFSINGITSNFYYLFEKILVALNEYAALNENSELLSFTSTTKECPLIPDQSSFMKKVKCTLTYAHHYLNGIEKFGIKKHHLVEFEMEVDNCEKYNLLNENEVKQKISSLLFRIDHLIESLKDRYPRFYNEYQMSKLNPIQGTFFENLSVW